MLSGLITSSDASSVMLRAIVSCLGCYGLGVAVGYVFELIAQRVVDRERELRGVAEADPAAANQKTSS
jgi:NhaP-type Na+/H+ or K+/H+ antiporter